MLDAEDAAHMESLKADMEGVLATLPPREAGVLRMRFGLLDGTEHTLDDIGLQYNVSCWLEIAVRVRHAFVVWCMLCLHASVFTHLLRDVKATCMLQASWNQQGMCPDQVDVLSVFR